MYFEGIGIVNLGSPGAFAPNAAADKITVYLPARP